MSDSGSVEAWRALATRCGRATLSSFTSTSDDGLKIDPLYAAGRGSPLLGCHPGRPWIVSQRIDDWGGETPERVARRAIEGGATGLALVYPDSATAHGRGIDFAIDSLKALGGVSGLDHLRLDGGEDTINALGDGLADLLEAGFPEICVAFDPIATFAAKGAITRPFDAIFDTISTLASLMNERGAKGEVIAADGRPWHDAGATEAEELAAVLAAAVAYVRVLYAAVLPTDGSANRLAFVLSADTDQFLTIAKIRAMRLLLARLDEMTGLAARTCHIHAETSWRMMCRRDPYLNILRTTGAALSAAAAGIDSLTVLPFDLGGDSFAERIARNVQTISLDEAALFRFSDPGAGSGAIESLTNDLAAAAWARFQSIEAEGGLLESVRSGAIQKRVAASRHTRSERIARREIEIVGVNAHVDPSARQAADPPQAERPRAAEALETTDRLESARLAEPFERLCDQAEGLRQAGTPPLVFVAGIGDRATFGGDGELLQAALATGGLEISKPEGFATPEAAKAAFLSSNACLACILGNPDTSDTEVEAYAEALRAGGARRILLWPPDVEAGSFSSSIASVVGPKSNLPSILANLLDAVAN